MTSPQAVVGVVQHYAWGDTDFLPTLLGQEPDGQPYAELWLGTHPNGPTTLDDGTLLSDITGELPYLLKVLCAAEPLSLQAHPTVEQAVEGFNRGTFTDPHAKPELLVALTAFEALCGFRPYGSTIEYAERIGAHALAELVQQQGADSLAAIFHGALAESGIVVALEDSPDQQAQWAFRLGERYGMDDPSVLATLLLNYVTLQPGEALHLTAGNLHAYLRGSGIELMGASDNVVRGGLTVKPIDVDLLLDVADPSPLRQPIMQVEGGRYPLPGSKIELLQLDPGDQYTSCGHELAISLDGRQLYLAPDTDFTPTAITFVVTAH